jgi:hypothetical protein
MEAMRTRMTITKTTTALATSALLVLGLAACGGSGDDASTDTETTASEETTPADEESTETEATDEETTEETGDTEASGDFCVAYQSMLDAQSTLGSIDSSDPSGALAEFESFTSQLEAAEAPAEISADWDTVSGAFRQITDTLETAINDPANADISGLTAIMTDESFQTSAQNVAVYGTQNC